MNSTELLQLNIVDYHKISLNQIPDLSIFYTHYEQIYSTPLVTAQCVELNEVATFFFCRGGQFPFNTVTDGDIMNQNF